MIIISFQLVSRSYIDIQFLPYKKRRRFSLFCYSIEILLMFLLSNNKRIIKKYFKEFFFPCAMLLMMINGGIIRLYYMSFLTNGKLFFDFNLIVRILFYWGSLLVSKMWQDDSGVWVNYLSRNRENFLYWDAEWLDDFIGTWMEWSDVIFGWIYWFFIDLISCDWGDFWVAWESFRKPLF